MPKFLVTAPDGSQYEVNAPEGATEADAIDYIRKTASPKVRAIDAPSDPTGSFLENALAGGGKALTDLYRGGKQILGVGDQDALQAEIDESKRLDAPLMATGGGIVGNIAGNVAATAVPGGVAAKGMMAFPKVAAIMQSLLAARPIATAAALGAGTGAVTGALEPVETGGSRAGNAALGATVGAAGGLIPGVLSRVVKPQTGAAQQALLDEGVRLTPGQILGGAFKTAEEKAVSIPVLGHFIKSAQQRGMDDFNRAGFNRALAPIGQKVGPKFNIGREGVAEVADRIGAVYDDVLDRIGRVDIDPAFHGEVNKVVSMAAADMGEANTKQLQAIIKTRVLDEMTPAGTMSAETMKKAESELGRRAAGFMSSADENQRQLGAALREVQASLRRNVERSAGPDLAAELQGANKAWASFVRIQDAAGRIGAVDGVFTPAQLTSAVRKGDKSVRHGAFAKGDALMQDLADSGKGVMGSTVNNSGTTDRMLLAGLAGGGYMLPAETVAGILAGSAAYSRPAQAMIRMLLTERPELAGPLAEILKLGAPAGGVASGLLAPSLTGP